MKRQLMIAAPAVKRQLIAAALAKRQLLIAALVVIGVLALIGKLAPRGPEKPFTREGIHVVPTPEGADATDGKFRINLPEVPTVIRGDSTTVALATRSKRVNVLFTIATPKEFAADDVLGLAGGFTLGFGITNPTWTPGTLAGLNAGTASGDGTWEDKPRHIRMWAVAAPTQKRFYVLVAIGTMDTTPADLEQVATRIAFVNP